jgi:hypothetical protein
LKTTRAVRTLIHLIRQVCSPLRLGEGDANANQVKQWRHKLQKAFLGKEKKAKEDVSYTILLNDSNHSNQTMTKGYA